MPELRNFTPFPNFRYYSTDAEGGEFGIVIAKGTFEIAEDGTLVPAEEQAPMMFTDACFGEVNVSSLWHPSDLVPHKPGTDVIVNATAHALGGEPMTDWSCGIRIERPDGVVAEKMLRVTGPRVWEPRWKRAPHDDEDARDALFEGWSLGEPEPALAVPLRYENAFGGEIETGRDENDAPIFETSERNPIGVGMIDRDATDRSRPVPAPQVEALDEPITDPFARPAPQSLGAIPPAWLPRRPKGGTYDQDWMDNVWPAWPADYDFAYHNSAHPDLTLDGYLDGTERVRMLGLAPDMREVAFDLPGKALAVMFAAGAEKEQVDMDLDTLLVDASSPDRADWRVFVTWRCRFEADRWESASIFVPRGQAMDDQEQMVA